MKIIKNSYKGVNNHSKSKKKKVATSKKRITNLKVINLVINFQNRENTQSHLLFCKEGTRE